MLICNNDSCEHRKLCEKCIPCILCNESYLCMTQPDYEGNRENYDVKCPYLMVGPDKISVKLTWDKNLVTFDSVDEVLIYLQLQLKDSTEITIVNLSGLEFWKYTNTLSEIESMYRKQDCNVTEYLKWHK